MNSLFSEAVLAIKPSV